MDLIREYRQRPAAEIVTGKVATSAVDRTDGAEGKPTAWDVPPAGKKRLILDENEGPGRVRAAASAEEAGDGAEVALSSRD